MNDTLSNFGHGIQDIVNGYSLEDIDVATALPDFLSKPMNLFGGVREMLKDRPPIIAK